MDSHLLVQRRCEASPRALADREIADHLAQTSGWCLHDGAIERTFEFKAWFETIAFVNALAWVCEREDHHPDLSVSFDRCAVRFSTHSAKGITINDFICAAKADGLVAFAA